MQVDRLFDLPSSSDQVNQLKLIRAGLITPFDSQTTQQKSHDNQATKKDGSHATVSLADFDWLGIEGKGKAPARAKKTNLKQKTRISSSPSSGTHTSEIESETLSLTKDSDSSRSGYIPKYDAGDSDSYVTDEELGGKKRKRDISSEESDGELIHVNWSEKKRTSKRKRKSSGTVDDGNEELFRTRIK